MNTPIRVAGTLLALIAGSALAQTTAITGATVHTVGPAGTLENATIIIDGGRITDVGTNISIPAGATRIDASGKIITPGLFSPLGQIGLSEVGAVAGTNDSTQRGEDFAASFDVADAFNPRSIVVAISRIDGVTRAGLTPHASEPDELGNFSHVLSGLGSVVHLGDNPEHVVRHGAVVVANFGEIGSGVAGGSRAAAVQVLRAALNDALDYQRNQEAYDRGDWREYSVSRTDLDALQSVLDRSAAMLFNVNRASDISVVIHVAEEFNIRAIVAGGSEAWMVADRLAAAGVPVILDGINNLPGNFDLVNARLDSAGILVNAGVTVAFGASAQTHNARLLTQSAGISVANGLTWDQALEAITLAPARIYGVDGFLGSLETGKEADLVVWSADPLELTSYPDQVYIRGDPVSMQSRQTLLRARYLQTESERPPAFRN
ncbi:MAG: amidohydrolase family protein [Proteobacteria bacterium]|nr:amidohydrolase family protein [Pseudomonadota bacterium]